MAKQTFKWGCSIMIDDVTYRANINGMDALHKGIEFDFIYKILPKS